MRRFKAVTLSAGASEAPGPHMSVLTQPGWTRTQAKTSSISSISRGIKPYCGPCSGLRISQGALMNMFARTARAFEEKKGVFCRKSAVVHMADFTRSAEVVRKTMDGHRPNVWAADRTPRNSDMERSIKHASLISPARRLRFGGE